MSFDIFKEIWAKYQSTVRAERLKYFSDIFSKKCHTPRILFQSINAALSASQGSGSDPSPVPCEKFLQFFIDKIASERALTVPAFYDPSNIEPGSTYFNSFKPVSLGILQDSLNSTKLSTGPVDFLPARLIKDSVSTTGPSILANGVVLPQFKPALVQVSIKKKNFFIRYLCTLKF